MLSSLQQFLAVSTQLMLLSESQDFSCLRSNNKNYITTVAAFLSTSVVHLAWPLIHYVGSTTKALDSSPTAR